MLCCHKVLIPLAGAAFLLISSALHADKQAILIDGPDTDLTVIDMQKALLSMDDEDRGALLGNPGGIRRLMDTTYLAKVAAERAKKKGLDKTAEIQARLWVHEMNVLAMADMDEVISRTDLNFDAAAKEYYTLHKDEFQTGEMVAASHILIRGKTTDELQAAQEKIQHIKKLIDTGELSFEAAAKKYSQDGSAAKGGYLGKFGKGQMVKPFENTVFALAEPGQVSEPVKTRFGYHLIRLDEKIPPHLRPFNEVKSQIIAKLKEKKLRQIREDYLVEIRDDPAIKLNDEAIESFAKTPTLK